MLKELINAELKYQQKYKPISNGKIVAILLVTFCLLSIPFYVLLKLIGR